MFLNEVMLEAPVHIRRRPYYMWYIVIYSCHTVGLTVGAVFWSMCFVTHLHLFVYNIKFNSLCIYNKEYMKYIIDKETAGSLNKINQFM